MIARRDQHKPVFGKGEGLQLFGGIDLVSDNADLGKVSSDGAHDLAAGALFQVDIDQGMLREERRQGHGEKLGGCGGIGEQAHARPKAVRVLRQLRSHSLQLLNDELRVMGKCRARGRSADAAAMSFEERRAEALFHQPDSLAG